MFPLFEIELAHAETASNLLWWTSVFFLLTSFWHCTITADNDHNTTTQTFFLFLRSQTFFFFWFLGQGIARTQSPLRKNYAPESPTFGAIAGVSPTEVQWKGLDLGGPPSWSGCLLCQVSMIVYGHSQHGIEISHPSWRLYQKCLLTSFI